MSGALMEMTTKYYVYSYQNCVLKPLEGSLAEPEWWTGARNVKGGAGLWQKQS